MLTSDLAPASDASSAVSFETDHPSTASVAGHPLHPMVVPLPIGMLVAAGLSDMLGAATRDRFFARASRWLLRGTVVTAAPAALLGAIDFATIPAARRPAGVAHAAGNSAMLAVSIASLLLRRRTPEGVPVPARLLTVLAVALVSVTGWLGGELSYRNRIGVIPHTRG
jgi:uncharacterized membrane protein